MVEEGIITMQRRGEEDFLFVLTEKGGALWEAEREPDWSAFCQYDVHYNVEPSILVVESPSHHTARAFVEAGYWGTPVLSAAAVTWFEDDALLPWKRFPRVCQIIVPLEPEKEVDPEDEDRYWAERDRQLQYQRTWWSTLGECVNFPPRLELHLRETVDADLRLATEIRLLGAKAAQVENVDLMDSDVTDGGLEVLNKLTRLKELWLGSTGVTGAGLAHLRGLESLEHLQLERLAVADDDLLPLSGINRLRCLDLKRARLSENALAVCKSLPALKDLILYKSSVTDEGVRHLAGLKQLDGLWLSFTAVTDRALEWLESLENLRRFLLRSTAITDAGLVHLEGMKRLEHLDLHGTRTSGQGLVHLAGMKGLEHLRVGATGVTDQGLAHLGGMKKLTHLDLEDTGITDRGIEALASLDSLQHLSLDSTSVTDRGFARLAEILPGLTSLHADDTELTDDGLRHLARLPLERLCVRGTRISDAGIEILEGMTKLQIVGVTRTPTSKEAIQRLWEERPLLCRMEGVEEYIVD
jgi:hypothetical protein